VWLRAEPRATSSRGRWIMSCSAEDRAAAVSKIAQLSPMGEPLARILGVTIDPYVV